MEGRPPAVLIVEDETDLAEDVSASLREAGFATVLSTRASDALGKLRNQEFICILLDINLEKGTGDQIVEPLRSNPKHLNHRTPILVASSHLEPSLIERIGKGIQGAVVKPYDLDEVVEKIKDLSVKYMRLKGR